MNVNQLASILGNTFNPDSIIRTTAESSLYECESTVNYHSTLLQILTLASIPIEIQTAAILRLKNNIRKYWTITKPSQQAAIAAATAAAAANNNNNTITDVGIKFITASDRTIIKENLFAAIVFHINNTVIRNQLLECLYEVSRFDWPEQYPSLIQPIISAINQSENKSLLYAGLLSLRMLFKSHHLKIITKRKPINDLVPIVFPILYSILNSLLLLPVNQLTIEYYEYIRNIIKIFRLATDIHIPPYLRQKNSNIYLDWMKLIQQLLIIRLPDNTIQSINQNQLLLHPLIKTQKWCSKICLWTFDRFGRPNKVSEKTLKPFAKQFNTKLTKPLLLLFMQLMKDKRQGLFLSPRVEQVIYRYFSTAIGIPDCYLIIRQNLKFLIEDCLLVSCCLTNTDIQCFTNDPDEFVRRSLDITEEFDDPRLAAQNMLITLIRADGIKQRSDSIELVINIVTTVFNQYLSITDPSKRNYILKDGAMRMFGSIRQKLLESPNHQLAVENLFILHIIPEFTNSIGFMRARACTVFGRYSKLQWANQSALNQSIQLLIQCSKDSELPVRLESCTALARIVRNKSVKEYLIPALPILLEQMFSLIDEIGSWEVIDTLSIIVEEFGDNIGPFAASMVQKLTTMYLDLFQQYRATEISEDELAAIDFDDSDGAETGKTCIVAIKSIIFALENCTELIPIIESIIQPLLDCCLSDNGMDVLEDILDIIGVIVYLNPNGISPFMWSLYPRMLDALTSYADDYLPNIAAPIDNYISAGTEYFIKSDYFIPTLSLCKSLIERTDINTEDEITLTETPGQYGGKLLESILANSRFQIDSVVPDIIKLVGNRLLTAKSLSFKLVLIDVLSNAIYYNPGLFIATLNSWPTATIQSIMNYYLSHIEQMKSALTADAKRKYTENQLEQLDEDEEIDPEELEQAKPDIFTVIRHEKLAVLGLSSLCLVPISTFPVLLQQAFPTILQLLLTTLASLKEEYKEADELGSETDSDNGYDHHDQYEGDPIDELDELNENNNNNNNNGGGDYDADNGGEDGSDDDNADNGDDFHNKILRMMANHESDKVSDQVYESPLDDLDEFIFFAQSLESLSKEESGFYSEFTTAINKSQKQQQLMKLIMDEAIERKIKQDKEKAEEAEKSANNGTAVA